MCARRNTYAKLVQGLLEFHDDTLDDWRDLLEYQEQRMQLEIESSRVYLFKHGHL